jgi:ABC-2 type transport system permease protein
VALGDDLRRFADIAYTLARMEFKLHYHGSVLGYLWAVMRPLMLFGVTYFVFTHVGSFNRGVQDYAVYLLTSIVLWTFFAEATTGAASSLLKSQDLLRKLRFPRLAVPLSVVLKATFNLGANLIAVVALVAISGVQPRLTWLEFPLLVVLLVVLAAGIGTLVSALFVRFRDVAQIWAVLAQLLFLGSSVLYVVTQFPREIQQAMVANPLAMIFTQMRHALIDPSAPSAAAVAGGSLRLLIPLGITFGILGLGLWAFTRASRRMAENL